MPNILGRFSPTLLALLSLVSYAYVSHNYNKYNWNENAGQNMLFSYIIILLLPIHRFMQQLEDALNTGLCGHFLILLATMCFAAFSVVTVQYENCCML